MSIGHVQRQRHGQENELCRCLISSCHLPIINRSVNNYNMSELHKNPFKFGDPVEGDYYLPHPALAKTVTQFLENRIHVVLIGPRRFGKTSFVLDLLKHLEKKSYSCIFV